jgi:hypothetical protein
MPYDTNYGKPDRFRGPAAPVPTRQPDPDPTFLPLPDPVPWTVVGGGGAGGGIYGQVQSGGGGSADYLVQTFSAGPNGPPDDPPITVTVLGLDPTETIPAGTWIGSIATTTDSNGVTSGWCTVPVWMGGASDGGGQTS